MAVFTYQLLYWSWVKLETDEIRAETDGERLIAGSDQRKMDKKANQRGGGGSATIADLESKVEDYKKKTAIETKDAKNP